MKQCKNSTNKRGHLEDDWDGRNLLYSLRFNIGTAILIPGCNQREVYLIPSPSILHQLTARQRVRRHERARQDILQGRLDHFREGDEGQGRRYERWRGRGRRGGGGNGRRVKTVEKYGYILNLQACEAKLNFDFQRDFMRPRGYSGY
jgi:hypothetical protein